MRRRATSGEMARGGLVFVFFLEVAPVSEGDSFTRSGVVRHACRHRVTARGVFVLGIVSHAREWRSGNAKRSFAGRIPKRRVCEKIPRVRKRKQPTWGPKWLRGR